MVNASRTLPAAVTAVSPRGEELVLHFSSPYPADERLWVVEPRLPAGSGTAPFRGLHPGDRLALPGGASIDLREPYMGERLWVARPRMVGSVESYLGRRGRPIRLEGDERIAAAAHPEAGRLGERAIVEEVRDRVAVAPQVREAGIDRGDCVHHGSGGWELVQIPFGRRGPDLTEVAATSCTPT